MLFFKKKPKKVEYLDAFKLFHLIESEDIIEIKSIFDNEIHTFGTSSETDGQGTPFKNKQYFIDSKVYESANELFTELKKYIIDGKIPVYKIDDIPANKYFPH